MGRDHLIRKAKAIQLSNEHALVRIRKIFSPSGERLEIEAPDIARSIRLDAIALEGLSWQERGDIPDIFGQQVVERSAEIDTNHQYEVVKTIRVTNEFATVEIRKILVDRGDLLEIESPKLGYALTLTPSMLESLTGQRSGLFSGFLEEPFGPSPD